MATDIPDHEKLRAQLAEAYAAGDGNRLLALVPFAGFLGLKCEHEGPDEITVLMPSNELLVGNPGLPALHGGVVGALLESTAIATLVWAGKNSWIPKTINFTVDYLRVARVKDTRARAVITKQGRRVANVQVQGWQDDEREWIATAHGHFLLKP